jgi:ribonuclease BN (tRNA processing enzyme)
MNIHILGAHSNESKTARCVSILVDNTLAIDAGALTSTLSLNNQRKINSILLTHVHFDHIKDIPLFALNSFRMNKRINIYALPIVNSTITMHLLNGQVYPELYGLPAEKPTVNFHRIVPLQERLIEKYRVLAIPVIHHGSTVGYQVCDSEGKGFFYTADTGPGLRDCWQHMLCQILIIETTLPNAQEDLARETGHLTPKLLRAELITLREVKQELPQIVVIHNDPLFENRVRKEIAEVAADLKIPITIADEGMRFKI